ncbi:hypothetical protein ABPG74_010256 [Tetrahymena malaccensis]
MSQVYNNNNNNIIRILVCGNQYVGKTSLIQKLRTNDFQENYTPTVGVDFTSIKYEINQKKVQLRLFDISGQNRYLDLIPSQVRNIDGVVFIYDITDLNSFLDITMWLNKVDSAANINIFKTLIGNKCDLSNRQVPYNKGQEFSEEYNMNFFETSVRNGKDVQQSIYSLANKIFFEKQKQENHQTNQNQQNQSFDLRNSNSFFKTIYKRIQYCYC